MEMGLEKARDDTFTTGAVPKAKPGVAPALTFPLAGSTPTPKLSNLALFNVLYGLLLPAYYPILR